MVFCYLKHVLIFLISNVYLDVQELQHAVSAQQIASPHPYKKDYKEQIVGKGPHDPTIGYPEHEHHKKVGELTSSVRFCWHCISLNIYSTISVTVLDMLYCNNLFIWKIVLGINIAWFRVDNL